MAATNLGRGVGADMYSDAAPAETEAAPEEGTDTEQTDEMGGTYTLPIEALAGKDFKPGDELVLEVVRINENSVEVKYAPESGTETEAEAEPAMPAEAPAAAPGGGGAMSAMLE